MEIITEPIGVSKLEARRIAGVLSGNLKVPIEEGEAWAYDFKKKSIIYRPEDLSTLTEREVVANLLHEAGHAKYSLAPSDLKWGKNVEEKHRSRLSLLVNVIEDFRIEDQLRKDYPYAKDYLPEWSFKTKFILESYAQQMLTMEGKVPKYLEYCFQSYAELAKVKIYNPLNKEVKSAVRKTKGAANMGRYSSSTQDIANTISQKIYEHIKPFLDEWPEDKTGDGVVFAPGIKRKPYEKLYKDIEKLIPPTTRIFERLLTDVKYDKYGGHYRSGPKIDTRKLYKARTGNTRVFQKRIEAGTKKYIFSLLVDISGSMTDYDKLPNAIRAAMLFAAVLDKLKIPYVLHSFNANINYHKKPHNKINVEMSTIWEEMWDGAYSEAAAYNNDGLAVKTVSEIMNKYAGEGRRVMFVMSDGNPVEDHNGMNFPLEREIEIATKQGIEIIGIGIGYGHCVGAYYNNNALAPDVRELPAVLVKTLKKAVRKH